jgi:hypothetical protein
VDLTRGAGPAKYLHFFAFDVEDEKAPGEELEIWCRAEHGKLRAKCPEYRQMRRYRLASSSVLSGFVRSFPDTPTWLVLREFEGEVDWEALSDVGARRRSWCLVSRRCRAVGSN